MGPQTNCLTGDIEKQTRRAREISWGVLPDHGIDMEDVLKATVYPCDMDDFLKSTQPAVNVSRSRVRRETVHRGDRQDQMQISERWKENA